MHVDQAGRHYTTVGGERRAYPMYLLRRSFRNEQGRPRKQGREVKGRARLSRVYRLAGC
jgi:hypothetical protein